MISSMLAEAIGKYDKSTVDLHPPASAKSIARAELLLGRKVDGDLGEFYKLSNGAEFRNPERLLRILTIEHLVHHNREDDLLAKIPDMLLIGFDAGALFVFLDPNNKLHRGAEAVYAGSMGACTIEFVQFLAPSLTLLLEEFRTNVALFDAPYLDNSDLNSL